MQNIHDVILRDIAFKLRVYMKTHNLTVDEVIQLVEDKVRNEPTSRVKTITKEKGTDVHVDSVTDPEN